MALRTQARVNKAAEAAHLILMTYEEYRSDFERLTAKSWQRFEECDWKGRQRDAVRRLDIYEHSLDQAASLLTKLLNAKLRQEATWREIKRVFETAVSRRYDRDLAETYYNSITRKILQTVGIDRTIEFFRLEPHTVHPDPNKQIHRTFEIDRLRPAAIEQMLTSYGFRAPFRDLRGDAALVAQEINLRLWPLLHFSGACQIDMVSVPFFRNKVAYLVGRIIAAGQTIPLILPLYNGDQGIYVDTVLLEEADASIVFSFAFSYFHVRVKWHHELIGFLRSILPSKPLSDLYFSIGYIKHGKTEFYRALHHYVHESKEQFVIAPGKEGAVMICFTMPEFGYVFKIIKDRPCFLRSSETTNKRTDRDEVVRQYAFVCRRDRVGRMVDTQEFENLRFKRKRFSTDLLNEFRLAATQCISIERDNVVITHLYVQRKVIPLPMYLQSETDAEAIRRVVLDFGYFLKDLASVGVFPSDLFNIWNYGVTRRGRVVLFDYDDVSPLESVNFRYKPEPKDYLEELEPEEDRIAAMPNDFFLDETMRFSGIPIPLQDIFRRVHGDLFTTEYWLNAKRRVKRGDLADITPYDRRKKFSYRLVVP